MSLRGESRIRTYEGGCHLIYSQAQLATLVSPPDIDSRSFTNRIRADGGTRTPDLLITNQLLYQLSYSGFY